MSEQIATLRAAIGILSLSLDYATALQSLAQLAVSHLCDACAVFIDETGKGIRCLAIARNDGSVQSRNLTEAIYPNNEDGIREAIGLDHKEAMAFLCVPFTARGRRVGSMAFVRLDSQRPFDDKEAATARDLASASSIAMQYARLYREIQDANRIKNEFVAMVSHELRTPLTPILGCVHLLRTANLSETNFNRALEMIERNAQAQVQIVQDLLDVSQIVAGRLRLARRVVDPTPIVESAVDSVRALAEFKTIELVSKLDPIDGELDADPDRLRQVVWNLLSNAVKFTPPGGKVEVAMYAVKGNVEITVTDTGVGIAPEVLPYIFDRFGQADDPNAKLRSGLGLGLAIVRHVLDLHGGTVIASSPGAGSGATFILRFPLQARKVAAATS